MYNLTWHWMYAIRGPYQPKIWAPFHSGLLQQPLQVTQVMQVIPIWPMRSNWSPFRFFLLNSSDTASRWPTMWLMRSLEDQRLFFIIYVYSMGDVYMTSGELKIGLGILILGVVIILMVLTSSWNAVILLRWRMKRFAGRKSAALMIPIIFMLVLSVLVARTAPPAGKTSRISNNHHKVHLAFTHSDFGLVIVR